LQERDSMFEDHDSMFKDHDPVFYFNDFRSLKQVSAKRKCEGV